MKIAFSNGVSLVEWAELIQPLIPETAIHITIEKIWKKVLIIEK